MLTNPHRPRATWKALAVAILFAPLPWNSLRCADVPWRVVLIDETHPDLPVPPPEETPVEIVLSGRTSTLKSITIVKVGQKIPVTYAGKKMNNTSGFTWYVTRHYAMKVQVSKEVPESAVVDCLTVSELAYPHQVRVVGREPTEIDTRRMAIVYAKNIEEMRRAVKSDLGQPYTGGGGGVTLYSNTTAYNYPSGGLTYHKRDLVMHENLHMLVMCAVGKNLGPVRLGEGITHAFSSHVYDEEKKRLTVAVLDRAPPNDPYDRGLRQLEESFISGSDFYEGRAAKPYRPPVYTLFTQFCWSDPDRLMKWRLWRDGLYQLRGINKRENDRRLMTEIFGPPEEFDKVWRAWIAERRNSYHYAAWGWEQVGNALQAWGWPAKGFRWSQMDLNYSPAEEVAYDPLRMDYPAIPVPALVGQVKRGVAEPAMGCVVDFGKAPDKGVAGLAFARTEQKPSKVVPNQSGKLVIDRTGVGGRKETLELPKELKEALKDGKDKVGLTIQAGDGKPPLAAVLVHKCRELLIQAEDIGLPKKVFKFPAEFIDSMKANGNRAGMNVKIAREALEITLRAGPPDAMKEAKFSEPIDAKQREMLMNGQMSVLAKDGRQRVTPFIDVGRRMGPDLSVPAPLGRWRFPGEDELQRLYAAARILGGETPASLTGLKETMLAAFDKDADAQRGAMATYRQGIAGVRRDLLSVPDEEMRGRALAALMGISFELNFHADSTSTAPVLAAAVRGATDDDVTGNIQLEAVGAALSGPAQKSLPMEAPRGKIGKAIWRLPIREDDPSSFRVKATARLKCADTGFTLKGLIDGRPSVLMWWIIGPFDNPGGGAADIAHLIEKEPISLEKAYVGQGNKQIEWQKVERNPESKPESEFVVSLNGLYGGPKNVAAYAVVWAEASKEMDATLAMSSEDGFVAWVNRKRVHSVLEAPRTYRSRGDRIPIHLKKGRNEILLKITLTAWGWKFGACVTAPDDTPLEGVRFSLEGEQAE